MMLILYVFLTFIMIGNNYSLEWIGITFLQRIPGKVGEVKQ